MCVSLMRKWILQLLRAFEPWQLCSIAGSHFGQLVVPCSAARGPRRPSLCLSTGAAMFVVI